MLPERLICVMTCYFLPADVVKLHRPSVPARRSSDLSAIATGLPLPFSAPPPPPGPWPLLISSGHGPGGGRSEEHTPELQSRPHLVCRRLLVKKRDHLAGRRDVDAQLLFLLRPEPPLM